jgi:hypothetical protein
VKIVKKMAKKKDWREGEMILTFGLEKIDTYYTESMSEWLDVPNPELDDWEQGSFERLMSKTNKIATWSEEDLKMKFISPVLELGKIMEGAHFTSFFDKKLEGKVGDYNLSVKADFVIAKGLLDYMEKPYFHFQEYKPNKNPAGDSMAQLLEAFLIAQVKNNDEKPIYGCEVIGANWKFIVMEAKTYCVSKSFDSTDKEDLLKIIAILRKFKDILENKLL